MSLFLSFQCVRNNQNYKLPLFYWSKFKFWLIFMRWHDEKKRLGTSLSQLLLNVHTGCLFWYDIVFLKTFQTKFCLTIFSCLFQKYIIMVLVIPPNFKSLSTTFFCVRKIFDPYIISKFVRTKLMVKFKYAFDLPFFTFWTQWYAKYVLVFYRSLCQRNFFL